jgi:biopolymer transport protein ExbB/TolQ
MTKTLQVVEKTLVVMGVIMLVLIILTLYNLPLFLRIIRAWMDFQKSFAKYEASQCEYEHMYPIDPVD